MRIAISGSRVAMCSGATQPRREGEGDPGNRSGRSRRLRRGRCRGRPGQHEAAEVQSGIDRVLGLIVGQLHRGLSEATPTELSVKMDGVSARPHEIWLRSFYGFSPEDDGYIGWTNEADRDRMLGLVSDGDLFMIYGASSSETAKAQRNRVLGFLQVQGATDSGRRQGLCRRNAAEAIKRMARQVDLGDSGRARVACR
jgi:hypothetical protein